MKRGLEIALCRATELLVPGPLPRNSPGAGAGQEDLRPQDRLSLLVDPGGGGVHPGEGLLYHRGGGGRTPMGAEPSLEAQPGDRQGDGGLLET